MRHQEYEASNLVFWESHHDISKRGTRRLIFIDNLKKGMELDSIHELKLAIMYREAGWEPVERKKKDLFKSEDINV